MTAPAVARERRTIPFDYAFRFELTGELDRQHTSTVRVSVEANFVAVAIGYGVILRRDPLRFGPSRVEDVDLDQNSLNAVAANLPPGQPPLTQPQLLALPIRAVPPGVRTLSAPALALAAARVVVPPPPAPAVGAAWPPTLSDFRLSWIANALRRTIREEGAASLSEPKPPRQRAADLIEVLSRGIRFNREALQTALARGDNAPIDPEVLGSLFEEIPPDDARIQFLYRLMDEGTGREFQSDFILNTAGLGIHDGDRPFRQFATPIVFEPLATIRMDVIEKSDVPGELHVSLHGYRVLGGSGTPTDTRVRR